MGLTLVLGGIRSGKSAHAVRLAAAVGGRVAVVAIGVADDAEMEARIEAHRRSRPSDWIVHEQPRRAGAAVPVGSADLVLLESVDSLVTALADPVACLEEVTALVVGFPRVIAVSSEVGLSLVALTPAGRAFADCLGLVNQRLAAVAERVDLVVAGLPVTLKGGP